ncbi:hypothetical protein NPIL_161411, partial [Nephila pilipes]
MKGFCLYCPISITEFDTSVLVGGGLLDLVMPLMGASNDEEKRRLFVVKGVRDHPKDIIPLIS